MEVRPRCFTPNRSFCLFSPTTSILVQGVNNHQHHNHHLHCHRHLGHHQCKPNDRYTCLASRFTLLKYFFQFQYFMYSVPVLNLILNKTWNTSSSIKSGFERKPEILVRLMHHAQVFPHLHDHDNLNFECHHPHHQHHHLHHDHHCHLAGVPSQNLLLLVFKLLWFFTLFQLLLLNMLESRPEDALVILVKTVETVETVENVLTENLNSLTYLLTTWKQEMLAHLKNMPISWWIVVIIYTAWNIETWSLSQAFLFSSRE